MSTLLEKAKQVKIGRRILSSNEKIELALAWLKGEIRGVQVARALEKTNNGNMYPEVAVALRTAFEKGMLIIK